jgi:tetratricopeptide (TPR) repeat protein
VQLATSLAAAGELKQAREVIAPLARAFPSDATVQFQEARIALRQRDYTTARTSFERVLSLKPDSMEALEGIVAVDAAQGRTEAAAARLASRTADARSAAEAARYRVLAARLEIARNRPDAAIGALKDAISRDQQNIDAYLLLGQLYAARGQLDAAQQEFTRLAARRPDAAGSARTMLGIVQQMQGRTAEARGEYEAALEADPDAMVAANNLAWIYAEEGRVDEALPLAQRAASRLPSRPEIQDTLGWVYYRKGLPMHAAPAFEKSAELAPDNPTYAYHLGLAYAKAERRTEARRQLQRAISLGGDAPWIAEARAALAALDKPAAQATAGTQ